MYIKQQEIKMVSINSPAVRFSSQYCGRHWRERLGAEMVFRSIQNILDFA